MTKPLAVGPDARAARLKYRADIDGLRAIAVLLVLIFHFELFPIIKAGFLGVDIFFVISGFLITTILKNQLDTGVFSLCMFYVNRIRRLAPALLAILFMVMTAGFVWLFPTELIELSRQALVSQLYVANFYFWRNINYFGLGVHDVYLLHTWSLAVEEQFYLLYPACLWFLHSHLRKYFWSSIAVACLISFGLNVLFMDQKPEATFYLLPTRGWELLIGALLPFVASKWKTRTKSMDEMLGLLGVGLIALGAVCYRHDFRIPGYYALLPTIGAACLLLSGEKQTAIISKALSWPLIVYIGKISYSLYLVHWPLHIFAGYLIEDYSLGWRLGMFLLSMLLAALVYHAVEDPIRRRHRFVSSRTLLSGYATGLAATVSLFIVIYASGGLPQRLPDNVIRMANYVNDTTGPLQECEFDGKPLSGPNSFCRIGAENQTPSWVVYGDSHAWAAYPAFDKWLRSNGQAGYFIFRNSCPPVSGVHLFGDHGTCFAFNREVTDFIATHDNLKNIALVSIWLQAPEGRLSNSSQILPTRHESVQLFTDRFSQTLEHLHNLGRHIYVWEPVPGARKNVPRELARATLEHRQADIEFTLAEYYSTYQFFFDALQKNRQWIAASFSPSRALCGNGKCAVARNGVPLYSDNNHMTKSTIDFWVDVLQHHGPPNRIGRQISGSR